MLVSTILQDRPVPDRAVLWLVLWGTEPAGNRAQNRYSWWSTVLVTTLSPGTGRWTIGPLGDYIPPRPETDTEPVLCGSVVGSVLSTRRFCGFCTRNIYSPDAWRVRAHTCTRLGAYVRGPAVRSHRTYRTAGVVRCHGCTAGKPYGRLARYTHQREASS